MGRTRAFAIDSMIKISKEVAELKVLEEERDELQRRLDELTMDESESESEVEDEDDFH